jgi:hypothetical protein
MYFISRVVPPYNRTTYRADESLCSRRASRAKAHQQGPPSWRVGEPNLHVRKDNCGFLRRVRRGDTMHGDHCFELSVKAGNQKPLRKCRGVMDKNEEEGIQVYDRSQDKRARAGGIGGRKKQDEHQRLSRCLLSVRTGCGSTHYGAYSKSMGGPILEALGATKTEGLIHKIALHIN